MLATAFVALGAAVLIALFLTQDFPDLGLWTLFAAPFVFFEWRAVEIDDRLLVSPSVMVALSAAVVFGAGSAAVGVAAMAALGVLTREEVRGRRPFQPCIGFGTLVVTAAASVLIVEVLLPATISAGSLWRVAAASTTGAIVHAVVNFSLAAWVLGRTCDESRVPRAQIGVNHVSYVAMGSLGGLLGATYLIVGPVTLPLIFSAYVVGHLAFASFAELREAEEATLRGFVKALEAKDPYTGGHTERVAHLAEMIGRQLRYPRYQLRRLRWAALLHDVGKLAVPRGLISKAGPLTPGEYAQMQQHVHVVEDLLAEVEFLHPIVHIATAHHVNYDGSGYGTPHHRPGESPSQESCVLAVADAFDAMTSTRSYRVALSQEYALAELRRHAGRQFDPAVVEALVTALNASGERYGSDAIVSESEARRIAQSMASYARG